MGPFRVAAPSVGAYHAFFLGALLSTVGSAAPWVQDVGRPAANAPLLERNRVYAVAAANTLKKIDAVEGAFVFDFYLYLTWRDDRIAFPDGTTNKTTFDSAVYWSPLPEFINCPDNALTISYNAVRGPPMWARSSVARDYGTEEAEAGTWIIGQGRKVGTFDATYDLHDFPFDYQRAEVRMESTTYLTSELTWVPVLGFKQTLLPGGLVIDGWKVVDSGAYTIDYLYAAFDETYSRLVLSVLLKRESTYFTDRFVFNVALLVAMAILIGVLHPSEADRTGIVLATFLGVVSWVFVLVSVTPALGYSTRLDNFMNLSFGIIFVIYVYNALRYTVHHQLDVEFEDADGDGIHDGNQDDKGATATGPVVEAPAASLDSVPSLGAKPIKLPPISPGPPNSIHTKPASVAPAPPVSEMMEVLDSLPGNAAKKPKNLTEWMLYFHITKGRIMDWAVFATVGLCYLVAAAIIISGPAAQPAAKGTLL